MVSYLTKDDTIIQLLQNQNRQAIENIYDKYGAALYGVILRLVKCEETAKEVLQQSLLQIWKNAKQHDVYQGRLFSWMLQICRKKSIEILEIKKKQTLNTSTFSNYSAYNHKTLLTQMINLSGDSKKNILKLDKQYKEVIDLIYFQGYSPQEVAQTLQISDDVVQLRIKLATQKLRKIKQAA